MMSHKQFTEGYTTAPYGLVGDIYATLNREYASKICLEHDSAILVDESPYTLYQDTQENEGTEPDMFNPTTILDNPFEVTYKKQDGTVKTMQGTLVAPNYSGTPEDLFAYCVGLLEKSQIPVWTAQGWRSFIAQNVLKVEVIA
jgi:hypothetical protein